MRAGRAGRQSFQGRHTTNQWWTVDGDEAIESAVDLPCQGDALARVIDRRGGRLRVTVPAGHAIDSVTPDNFDTLAERDDDGRVFQVAWITAGPEQQWILAEDPNY